MSRGRREGQQAPYVRGMFSCLQPSQQQAQAGGSTCEARVGGIGGHLRAEPPGQQLPVHGSLPGGLRRRGRCRSSCRCCCRRCCRICCCCCAWPLLYGWRVAGVCHGQHVAVPHRRLIQADAPARRGEGRQGRVQCARGERRPTELASCGGSTGDLAGPGGRPQPVGVWPPLHLSRMWSQQ